MIKNFIYISIVLIISSFWIKHSWAASIEEIQEVRLAKAELALVDGDDKKAIRLIKKNLSAKNFHPESFKFLAQIYINKGRISKALKIYYFIIKKLHNKDILDTANTDQLLDVLDESSAPPRIVTSLYFRIGQIYYNLYNEDIFTRSYKRRLLDLSYKYFIISKYYKFNLPDTNYHIALVERERDNYLQAIEHFADAKELYQDKSEDYQGELDNINFLMADALIKEGHTDAGTLYLQSIYHSPKTDPALKEYANLYLDSLADSYTSISFSYDYNYNNNVHEITDAEFESDKDYYIDLNSYSQTKIINAFHSSKKYKYWSYLLTLNGEEELQDKEDLSFKDSRTLTGSVEIKYDNLIKSLAKLSYSYTQSYYKAEARESFTTYYRMHSITPQYIHTLKRGTITYKLPISFTKYTIYTQTYSNSGLSISYTPFIHSKFLSPSFTFEFTRADEDEGYDPSNQYNLSTSNHISLSDNYSLFLYLNYLINSNSSVEKGYNEYSLNAYMTYLFPVIKNLSINLSLLYEVTDEQDGDNIVKYTASLGLSYSF